MNAVINDKGYAVCPTCNCYLTTLQNVKKAAEGDFWIATSRCPACKHEYSYMLKMNMGRNERKEIKGDVE